MRTEVRVPTLGESVVDAVVGTWLKKEGEPVSAGDTLVELETEKVNVEITAEHAGVVERILKAEGETVAVGEVIAVIAGAAAEESRQHDDEPAAVAAESGEEVPRATPAVRRLASEHDIDLVNIPATGEGGRVTREDVLQYIQRLHQAQPGTQSANGATATPPVPPATQAAPSQSAQPTPSLAAPPSPPSLIAPPESRREERIRMSRRRRTIAQRLVEAQQTAALLTTFNEADMSAVMEIRKRRRDAFRERHGVGLGYMSFFTRAVVGALKAFPRLNAEIEGDEIVLKHYYDIGIAVGVEEGLVVPVVRDPDRKSFAEIEREIAELAEKARQNQLSIEEVMGGTFTITNGGVFGSLLSTPILNPPQVGILGMHKIEQRPVVVDGEIVIRPMMYLALSYDHRIVDGREAVQFLVRVKELIEDPETLLLEG
jgi:2-oxoglutarate dehydrogenase E2 component (dihydrolipoamide succinyltransferase)